MTTITAPFTVTRQMSSVREAFRLRRMARVQRHLLSFYVEHNLHDEARKSRLLMIDLLRKACKQWRRTLGIGP